MSTGIVSLLYDVAAVARERGIGITAAGLAYHGFNTLVPLGILLLVAVTLVDGLEVVLAGLERATGLDAAVSRDAFDQASADDGSDRVRASVLALGILLWSAIRLFRAVNGAFTAVYGSRVEQSPVSATITASLVTAVNVALVTLTVAVGVALVSVVGVSFSLLLDGYTGATVSSLVLFGLLLALFLPMYFLFPEADVTVREVLPGTAFAAVSWTVLAIGFRVYVGTTESVALFGVAGAVLLVLTWVYFGGLCLVLGAVLNAVLAERVEPNDEWVPAERSLPSND